MKRKYVTNFLSANALPLTIQACALLIFILNLWVASKLAPVAYRVANLEVRADYQDTQVSKVTDLAPVLSSLIQKVTDLNIKVDQMSTKLDRFTETNP